MTIYLSNFRSKFIIIVAFTLGFVVQVFAQNEKIKISGGIGSPDQIYVGVNYQLNKVEVGLSVGSIPLKNTHSITISSDIRYKFGEPKKLADSLKWYGRFGLSFMRFENEVSIEKILFLNPRIGREFNFSNKFGMDIDFGTVLQLHYEREAKNTSQTFPTFEYETPFLSFGIGFFYRI